MSIEWFVVASATQARLAQVAPGKHLVLVASFHHPEGRMKSAVLGDSRAGRELSDRKSGGAAFEPRVDAHRKEHLAFARDLAAYLEAAAKAGSFDTVSLMAGNPFLGRLKESLGSATTRRLGLCIPVNLTHVGEAELEMRLRQEIKLAA